MLLKRINAKTGKVQYVDRWSGREVVLQRVNPLKKEPDRKLAGLISRKQTGMFFDPNTKIKKQNAQKSAYWGNMLEAFRTKPEKRIRSKFILACKRCNVNPWPLLEASSSECFKSIGLTLLKEGR